MPAVPKFWRKIPERYNLIGTKCKSCDTVFFPPRSICPNCRRMGTIEEFQLSGNGEIVSYTKVQEPLEGFEDQAPYVMAIVELEEGPRITGQIADVKPEDVEMGKKVERVFRHIGEDGEDGMIYYGYKFRLIE